MEHRPMFSLVIPCYNSHETIDRLLASMTRQGVDKEDLEIIVVDDNSPNKKFLEIVDSYEDRLNITKYETDVKLHCPGNTRAEGMKHVHGQWICFCDHDDFYEDNALRDVWNIINETKEKYCICGIMRGWNVERNEFKSFRNVQAWLHGKFYNYDNLIVPYNIHFQKDLYTHEDIYWNSQVIAVMFELNRDWLMIDVPIYRWVDYEKSITRTIASDRGYLYENFQDYIYSAAEAYREGARQHKWQYVNQLMMTLLHAYFYYEAASYKYGAGNYRDNVAQMRKFLQQMMQDTGMAVNEIIDFIYSDAAKYTLVRSDCLNATGHFIEKTSFKDFCIELARGIFIPNWAEVDRKEG